MLRWCAAGMTEATKQFRRVNVTYICGRYNRASTARRRRKCPSRTNGNTA
jgi:hypothetical protein